MNSKKKALVCIDFINEIVHPDGKLAGKGYASFIKDHDTLQHLAMAQARFREKGDLVVHVRVGFSPSYAEHPAHSPLFGKAKEFGALTLGSWGTEFENQVAPSDSDVVVVKHRVSAFYSTNLDMILRVNDIEEIYIAGVATDLAVESAVRDAHDRDYVVTVLSDCCAAANDTDHANSLTTLGKIASVASLDDVTG